MVILLVGGCSEPEMAGDLKLPEAGPFIGLDLGELSEPDRRTIGEASEDFLAVVAGRKPVHAEFDEDAPLPADGGTTYYKGDRYELTAVMSISSFGEFTGMAYGPVLRFDAEFAPGNVREVSDIRIYARERLGELLSPPPTTGGSDDPQEAHDGRGGRGRTE